MDAYEDLKEDQRAGRYNPLKQLSEKEDYEERMRDILCMMMGECSAEFEKLPCLLDIDILRNILYDGVWNRYRSIQEKEKETDRREDEKNNDEKGKKADIVVFDGNLFETAIEEIRSRKVEVTFLNGRIVYSHE